MVKRTHSFSRGTWFDSLLPHGISQISVTLISLLAASDFFSQLLIAHRHAHRQTTYTHENKIKVKLKNNIYALIAIVYSLKQIKCKIITKVNGICIQVSSIPTTLFNNYDYLMA